MIAFKFCPNFNSLIEYHISAVCFTRSGTNTELLFQSNLLYCLLLLLSVDDVV